MKRHVFTVVFLAAGVLAAQDPFFINQNQSLLQLNPSFAGSNGGLRAQLGYRNQWPSLSANFVTYHAALDGYFSPAKGGIALSVMNDDVAHSTLKTAFAAFTYAQHIKLYENVELIPSVQAGYLERKLDTRSINFGDMIDPRYGNTWGNPLMSPGSLMRTTDLAAGLLATIGQRFAGGFALYHLLRPDIGMLEPFRIPRRLTLHGTYRLLSGGDNLVELSWRGQFQQPNVTNQLAINTVCRRHIIGGIGWMSGDLVFVNAGYRSESFSIVLGYDAVISKLAGSATGSWELHTGFYFRKKAHRYQLTGFEKF
jgi:type IX secretion system PorP/SprF family membrane protein